MLAGVLAGSLRFLGSVRALALAALLAVSLAGMSSTALAASVEGGNSFSELSRKAQEQEVTTSTESTSSTGTTKETRNSKTTILIGIGAAMVLLLGIASVIVRDARRRAPAEDPGDIEARVNRDLALQQRKRRAKAKAAREQRKRNR
jgi:hypothetical protein